MQRIVAKKSIKSTAYNGLLRNNLAQFFIDQSTEIRDLTYLLRSKKSLVACYKFQLCITLSYIFLIIKKPVVRSNRP
jgi:hypothetical protein